MQDQDFLDDFITESNDHLATVEDDILALESNGENLDNDVVNRLFRAVHTIKGSAGFLNMTQVKELAHALESVMGLVRNRKIIPNKTVSDALLLGADKLKLMINNLNHDSFSIEEEVTACEQCISSATPSQETPNPASKQGEKDSFLASKQDEKDSFLASKQDEKDNFFDLSSYDFSAEPKSKPYLYECTIDLIAECNENQRTFTSILDDLNGIGVLWDAIKNVDDDNIPISDAEGRSLFTFLLSTVISDDTILSEGLHLTPIRMIAYTESDLKALRTPAKKKKSKSRKVMKKGKRDQTEKKISTLQSMSENQYSKRNDNQETLDDLPNSHEAVLTHSFQDPTLDPSLTSLPANSTSFPTKKSNEQSVRISLSLLDKLMNLASELVLVRNQNMQAVALKDMQQLTAISQQLNIVTSDLQNSIMQTRMRPVGKVFSKFNRLVRDLAKKLGKEVELSIIGGDVELDKNIIEAIGDPLTHLVRNSVDHGIELPQEREKKGKPFQGHITLQAFHQAGQVNIRIIDDGKGMNPEILKKSALNKKIISCEQVDSLTDREAFNLIFEPGFSTVQEVTEVSGRGVGMDVVKTGFQDLGGTIDIVSTIDKGTTITIILPLTLAIIPTLIVSVEATCFAIPQTSILEVVWLHGEELYQSIKKVDDKEVYSLRGRLLPLVRLSHILKIRKTYIDTKTNEKKEDRRAQRGDQRQQEDKSGVDLRTGPIERRVSQANNIYIIVLKHGAEKFGLIVDTIVDTEEIVVKPLHDQLKNCKAFAGTTVMGDGRIAMILDIAAITELARLHIANVEEEMVNLKKENDDQQTMLLFDIGSTEQFVLPLCLITRVEEVKKEQIQQVNNREYLNFRNTIIPLIRMEKALPILSAQYNPDCQYVIIPKGKRPIGIIAANILDTLEVLCCIDSSTIRHQGIFGSQLINGRITLFLDTIAVIEQIEPDWFGENEFNEKIKKKILLIEDSIFYQKLISSFLRGGGVEVAVASNGQEALEVLSNTVFDGIISDIEMPVMDGFECAKHIRNLNNYQKTPLLAISTSDGEKMTSRIAESGFDYFKSKSNLEGLLEIVATLFGVEKNG